MYLDEFRKTISSITPGPYIVAPWPGPDEMIVVESVECGPVCVIDPAREEDAKGIAEILNKGHILAKQIERLHREKAALEGERDHLKLQLEQALWPGVRA